MTFQPFLRQTITLPTFGTDKAPSTLQIELYQPLSADSDYSLVPFGLFIPLTWIVGIQEYVDLDPWVGRSWTVCQDR